MRFRGLAIVGLIVAASSTSLAAPNNRPRGIYIEVDPSTVELRSDTAALRADDDDDAALILYLNRCEGGETFTPGNNDSRSNRSSIIGSTRSLPAYPYGDASWNAVLQCVRELYAPFNVEVTDVDPGSAPHDEAVVCGHPNDIGMQNGVGGVAPFNCRVIANPITFTFPEVWGNSPRNICETIAQESAHAWGLDHEHLCIDPMTYLTNCGNKSFQDIDADCGEFSPRSCQCGGTTQNSFRRLLALWGTATPTPPEVTVKRPSNGEAVEAGFPIEVEVIDSNGVDNVVLFIDGNKVAEGTEPPWIFNAPQDLTEGGHKLKAEATDILGAVGSTEINFVIGEPCSGNSDCADGEACVEGRCVPGPDSEGGLGTTCETGSDCVSGICGEDGAGTKVCTETCDVTANGCPGGFECRSAGSDGVCWPAEGGGGCAVSGRERGGAAWWLLAVFGLLMATRRRRVS